MIHSFRLSKRGAFCVLLFIFFLQNENPAQAKKMLWSGKIDYLGSTITEDPFGAYTGEFINPNEQQNYLQLRCLPQSEQGALIAVGTFRALNLAALGRFSVFFQYDFDITTSAFNHLQKAIIRKFNNRHEYLSILFTGKLQKQLIDDARKGKIDDQKFLENIKTLGWSLDSAAYYRTLRGSNLKLPFLASKYSEELSKLYVSMTKIDDCGFAFPPDLLSYLYRRDLRFFQSLNGITKFFTESQAIIKNTFFGNDQLYTNLRKIILEDRHYILTADLTTEGALRDLSQALRNAHQEVSVFDVSNAQQWIVNHRPVEFIEQYFKNLKRLPWSKEGRFFTTDAPVHADQGWDWKYFVLTPEVFPNLLEYYRSFRTANPIPYREDGAYDDHFYHFFGKPSSIDQISFESLGAPMMQVLKDVPEDKLYSLPGGLCQ